MKSNPRCFFLFNNNITLYKKQKKEQKFIRKSYDEEKNFNAGFVRLVGEIKIS